MPSYVSPNFIPLPFFVLLVMAAWWPITLGVAATLAIIGLFNRRGWRVAVWTVAAILAADASLRLWLPWS